MSEHCEILVAEDDETDVVLLQRAFKDAQLTRSVHFARDGQEAIDFLLHRQNREDDRLPALIVLDLKMPRRNGIEVLEWIRGQPAMRCLPVMIFSSAARREEVERAYGLGANGFLVKPPSTAQRVEVVRFLGEWLRLNQSPVAAVEGFQAAFTFHSKPPFG